MASSSWHQALPVVVATGLALGLGYYAYRQLQVAVEEQEAAEAQLAARPAARAPDPEVRRTVQALAAAGAAAACPSSEIEPAARPDGSGADAAAAPAGQEVEGGAQAGRKCDHCQQTPSGALRRCSRCKQAHYCSRTCQQADWGKHKGDCARLQAAAAAASAAMPSGGETNGAAQAAAPAAGAARLEVEGEPEEAKDVMQALGEYLSTQAMGEAREDPVRAGFEAGVLRFVRGDYRAAVEQLKASREASQAAGRADLAGDALRWLGHAHNKLGEPGRAAACFAEGCDMAESSGNKKLQVDCLSGLGVMYRGQANHEAAVGYLRRALEVAQQLPEQPELRATVLCNLGAAMMPVDPEAAVGYLKEAVELREAQVVALHQAGERAGLATAFMEHASAAVNLASALYLTDRHVDAEEAYDTALQVFDLIGDVDKSAKCLVNLANLAELRLEDEGARARAANHRRLLFELAHTSLGRAPPDQCAICLEAIHPQNPTPLDAPEARLLVLGCLHCFHNACWAKWSDKEEACPCCKAPMPLM